MSEHGAEGPEYDGTAAGAYSTGEHLRAQAEQKSDARPGVLVGDTDPTRPDDATPTPAASGDTEQADTEQTVPEGEGLGDPAPPKLG